MTERSPTRREFLGVGGSTITVGFAGTSWPNVTDAIPDHPFVPTADERWSVEFGDAVSLPEPVGGSFYVSTDEFVHAVSTDGVGEWQFPVEGDRTNVTVGPGAAASDESHAVYVDDDDRIYALAPDDGDVRWRYEDARTPRVHAAVSGVVVAFDSELLGRDDALFGISAADGNERWRTPLDSHVWLYVRDDGETLYAGTQDVTFHAVDADDGTRRWRVDLADEVADESPGLIAVEPTDDRALAWESASGTLYAFDSEDGTERWRFETDTDVTGFPGAVREDVAYLRDGDALRALSTDDGSVRWQYALEPGAALLPLVDGDTVYVGTPDGVHAVAAETGRRRWRSGTGVFPSAVADGTLVVDSRDTNVYGLDTEDGSVRWQYDAGSSLRWYPRVSDGTVYLGTQSGTVVALSDPGPTPVSDALRTVVSPAGFAVGGLLGGALAVGAVRRRGRATDDADSRESTGSGGEPVAFEEFELLDPISTTDYATVHEARAPDGTSVALKRFGTDEIDPDRFRSAVETWTDLDHEGVLDVRAWGLDPVPWLATEFADANLAERADESTTTELARAVADAAEAVHRAHREGVAHGRLAPENVLFADGDVRVADWRLGPELRESTDETDDSPEDDTYRLAATLADLLAGEQVGDDLREVLARALADDPGDRYDSALALADALRWAVRE